ncbi:MAG TPA: hypothetical protein VGE18_00815 [Candidatus Paceibacterota bacterium]
MVTLLFVALIVLFIASAAITHGSDSLVITLSVFFITLIVCCMVISYLTPADQTFFKGFPVCVAFLGLIAGAFAPKTERRMH